MPGPDIKLSSCDLFIDKCGTTITVEQLFAALITYDANGCPVIKATIAPAENPPAAVVQTPSLTRVTNAGSVAEGATSVNFFNALGSDATVAGALLKPGESVTFVAADGKVLGEIAYDGTGTELVISKVV